MTVSSQSSFQYAIRLRITCEIAGRGDTAAGKACLKSHI
jgi:hypothetical protein